MSKYHGPDATHSRTVETVLPGDVVQVFNPRSFAMDWLEVETVEPHTQPNQTVLTYADTISVANPLPLTGIYASSTVMRVQGKRGHGA